MKQSYAAILSAVLIVIGILEAAVWDRYDKGAYHLALACLMVLINKPERSR